MKFSAPTDRLKCVDPENKDLTVKRQSELLAVNRSSVYRKQHQDQDTDHGESLENLEIMNIIDRTHLKFPSWGYRKMTDHLRNAHGYNINRKRVDG